MKICSILACCFVLAALVNAESTSNNQKHKHHHKGHHKGKHHHHHHHHGKHHKDPAKSAEPAPQTAGPAPQKVAPAVPKVGPAQKKTVAKAQKTQKVQPAQITTAAVQKTKAVAHKAGSDDQFVAKMKLIESRLAAKKKAQQLKEEKGHIFVNGPLPADFKELFAKAVAKATGVDTKKVSVTSTSASKEQPGVFAIDFKADAKTVKAVESQVTDPDSKLAQGNLHSFLVEKDGEDEEPAEPKEESADAKADATPVEEKGIDIDTAMPYGDLEPFGREDTAQELTEDSIQESDQMVDQLERAEVAEEKRAVFRALTRLRGAAITSFDGVARSQTGAIDEYNKIHKWRETHPLHHLADEESDITKWAFPDNADF